MASNEIIRLYQVDDQQSTIQDPSRRGRFDVVPRFLVVFFSGVPGLQSKYWFDATTRSFAVTVSKGKSRLED